VRFFECAFVETHSSASLMITNDTDAAMVAGILVYSQPSAMPNLYTHAFDKNKKAIGEVLQNGLGI